MTKISLNKIPFDGPKTHTQIIEQIRADLAKTQNSISKERAELIVSSFFSKAVLFKDIPKKIIIWSHLIGSFYPARLKPKIYRVRAANKKRYNGAKKFLKGRAKLILFHKHNQVILKYKKWCAAREVENLPYVTMELYMLYRHLEFPEIEPVTREHIKKNLWRFNDQGKLVIKRNSPEMKQHFAAENAEKKAERALKKAEKALRNQQ